MRDNEHLYDEIKWRKLGGGPHAEMCDIWVRWHDLEPYKSGDECLSTICSEKQFEWLQDLEPIKDLTYKLMRLVEGEKLGGVLVTKLKAGGKIKPHTDSGFHAEHYDKYYIPIENESGATFNFEDGVIIPEIGDVWKFNNGFKHWVNNDSNSDRVALIVCIRNKHTGKANERKQ